MSSADKISVQISAAQKRGASTTHFTAPSGLFIDIVSKSLDAKASSIHIEPTETHVVVRCRRDGVMYELQNHEKKVHLPLVAHIRTIARVQPADHGAECEGIHTFQHHDRPYQLSISTLPTRHGEKVVISIKDARQSRTLLSLGMWGSTLNETKKRLSDNKGLLVIAGQEKRYLSQTIESMKMLLKKHGVEHTSLTRPTVKNLQLTRIPEGVLIVEEVGDPKVLRKLIEDNASKQLVVVALPISSVESVYLFLQSCGAQSHLIDHNVNAVLVQRGVRMLCANCRDAHTPNSDEMRVMYQMSGVEKEKFYKKVHELELSFREEFTDTVPQVISTTPIAIEQIYSAQKGGCDACFGTGFDGSMLLYELQSNGPSNRQISMAMDGVVKALCGVTSIEEVTRAVA